MTDRAAGVPAALLLYGRPLHFWSRRRAGGLGFSGAHGV